MQRTAAVDWSEIDTVLLDMDGTLLDLSFDNWFWQELIPRRYAELHGIEPAESRSLLAPRFRAAAGTIDWYCIDHWSRELGLDVGALKHAARARVRYLPGAERFLLKLRASGKRCVLITNAHPQTLAIKNSQLAFERHFDACYSAHRFGTPKEDPGFWRLLRRYERFPPARTLFVDDSLPALQSARRFGIAWLLAVRCPDSARPALATPGFDAIDRLEELL